MADQHTAQATTSASSGGISRSLFMFSIVYGGLVCISGVLGTKIVALGPLTLEAGMFSFLMLVVLSSAVNELHGPEVANRLVRFGFIPLILAALLIQVVIAMPGASFFDKQQEFEDILGKGARLMVAGLIAYGISQTLNVYVFDRLRAGTGKMVWLRGGIAAVISQLVDTTLFLTIAFLGTYPLVPLLVSGLIAKLTLSLIMVPVLVQLMVTLGRRMDGTPPNGDAVSASGAAQ